MKRDYATYKKVFAGIPMPFGFVDLDVLDENARAILKRSGDKKIRLATKSIRCRAITEHILSLSPQFQGLMTYNGAEAAWLAEKGMDDLLMGYPVWQKPDVEAIAAQLKAGKQIYCMIDSVAHVEHLNQIGAELGITIPVCLDADMSTDYPGLHFGVYRSSVNSVEGALKVYQAISQLPFVELKAVMGYEAQIAGVGDKMPGQGIKNGIIRWLKGNSTKKIAKRRAEIVAALQKAGASLELVNGGGTGSLEWTILEAAVTEVTVGSGFYLSHLFDHYSNFHHQPAAGYAVQIVREPQKGIFTAHGGGYTASGTANTSKQPQIWMPEGCKLFKDEGVGEVQTPFQYSGKEKLAPGDPVFLRHAKSGELCERFNTLYLLRDGKIWKEVPTYRGESMNFG